MRAVRAGGRGERVWPRMCQLAVAVSVASFAVVSCSIFTYTYTQISAAHINFVGVCVRVCVKVCEGVSAPVPRCVLLNN